MSTLCQTEIYGQTVPNCWHASGRASAENLLMVHQLTIGLSNIEGIIAFIHLLCSRFSMCLFGLLCKLLQLTLLNTGPSALLTPSAQTLFVFCYAELTRLRHRLQTLHRPERLLRSKGVSSSSKNSMTGRLGALNSAKVFTRGLVSSHSCSSNAACSNTGKR